LISNERETRVTSGTNLIVTTKEVIAISDVALTAAVVMEGDLIRRRHIRRLTNSVTSE
jgi:hypothetical protein